MKTGDDAYGGDTADSIINLVRSKGDYVPEPSDITSGTPVVARLDHGRWIGDCNLFDASRNRICLNAQYVHPEDSRFYCIYCGNDENGGNWRPVVWPNDRAAVEAPLVDLPVPEQNWTPPEE